MNSRRCKNWLGSYLEYTRKSEPPILYKTWTAISVIAACMRRKTRLKWGTIDVYPNLYIVLVGPPGRCRKGTAMSVGEGFLRELGIKLSSSSITREALIHQLKTSSDTHIDAAGKMFLHSSLTIFSKELTVFLGYNNQQLMADLTDWFDCADAWEYRTKNMGTDDITGVWVNLIGATTPDLLNSTLPKDAIGGGLTSRMIFVYEQDKDHTEVAPFLSTKEIELAQDLLIDLEQIAMLQGDFTATPEFIERFSTWYAKADSSPTPFDDYRFAPYFERKPTHLWKLSMILNAARTNTMCLDALDFEAALELLERTERMMPYTFSGYGKNKDADTLTRIMTIVGNKKKISTIELQKLTYLDADDWTLKKIVDTLQGMGYLYPMQEGSQSYLVYNDNYDKK